MYADNTQIIETRTTGDVEGILTDIVSRLTSRIALGKAIIITDQPLSTYVLLRGDWARHIQELQADRAGTEGSAKAHLGDTIARLQAARITTTVPLDAPSNDIFIMSPQGLLDVLPDCATMFIMTPVDADVLSGVARCMPTDGLIIRYTRSIGSVR